MAQLSNEERHAVKDCILRALNKLNDKDTQSTGVAELHEIFQKYVDTDIIVFLIPVICKPGEQSKPFARRECLRLLGALTSTICPKADVVFNTGNLMSRICSHLKTKLGDSDATVRETAAEVLGAMATNFHAVRQLPLPCNHALFKVAMDGLNGKKEQAAAAMALSKMAPHIDSLDPVIVKQLLKLLSLSSFNAKQHILAAFAHWQQENNRGGGFVTCARDSVLQSVGTLVGSNDSSNVGCLGCLASQDWGIRKAAAETLFALNRLLGPLLEHGASPDRKRIPRCIDALAAAKHDRVRPVRDAVSLAIAAFTELADWMTDNPGGDLLGWRLSCGTHPQNGRGSSSPTRSLVNGAGPLQGSSRANASAIRASAVFERFVASHPSGDTIKAAHPPPGSLSPPPSGDVVDVLTNGASRSSASPVSASEARATLESLQHLLEAAQRVTASPAADAADATAAAPAVAAPPPLPPAAVAEAPPRDAAPPLAAAAASQAQAEVTVAMAHIRGMVADLAGRVSTALETLERRVSTLEARAAAAPQAGPSTVISNPYFGHDRLNSPSFAVPAQRLSAPQLGPADMWLQAEEGQRGAATADGNMRMPPSGPPETSQDIQELSRESSKVGEDGDSTDLLLAHYGTMHSTMQSALVAEAPEALTLVPSSRSGSGHAAALPSPPPAASVGAFAAPRSPTAELLAAVPGGPPAASGGAVGGSGGGSVASSSLGGSRHVYEARTMGQALEEVSLADGGSTSPSLAAPSPPEMRSNPAFFQHGAAAAAEAAAAAAAAPPAAPPPLRRSLSGRSGSERVAKDVSTRVAMLLASRNDLQLLRLLQELAQPCWELLQPDVARGLLGTFCRWAENGSNLVRMKPWLYRLADEDNSAVQAVFAAAARQRAVEAVLLASRMPAKPGAADYGLLHSTLATVWGSPPSGDVASGGLAEQAGDEAGGTPSPRRAPIPPADVFQDLTSPLTDSPDSPSPGGGSVRDTLASIRTIRDSLAPGAPPFEPVASPAV